MEPKIFHRPPRLEAEEAAELGNSCGPTPEETERELKEVLARKDYPLLQLKLWKLKKELAKRKSGDNS